MGNFIITRRGGETVFRLESASGHLLATSKGYATLDACKKGLVSLSTYAPAVPLVDATAGERGPNPKFELMGSEGAYIFLLKAPNGKAVITSPPYATHKAALRALSMLRTGVADATVLLAEENMPRILKVGKLTAAEAARPAKVKQAPGRPAKHPAPMPAENTVPTPPEFPILEFEITREPTQENLPAATLQKPLPPAPTQTAQAPKAAPVTPRVVRLNPASGKNEHGTAPAPRTAPPAKSSPPKKADTPSPTVRGFIKKLFSK